MNNIKKGLVILSLASICVAGFAAAKPVQKLPQSTPQPVAQRPVAQRPAPTPVAQRPVAPTPTPVVVAPTPKPVPVPVGPKSTPQKRVR